MLPLPSIEHVILLMFENRSFDNMLGAFFPPHPHGGGVPVDWSVPWTGHGSVKAWMASAGAAAQVMPSPDPNESFADMQAQLFTDPPMQGFVNNYAQIHKAHPHDIMQYFRKENVPVTYKLATTYAVADQYFASGPVQTWPNRLFSLCGTPGHNDQNEAYLNNTDYPDSDVICGQLNMPSIFQQLDQQNKSWKVYYDDEAPISAIISYVWENWAWGPEGSGNVWSFEYDTYGEGGTFFDDVKNSALPAFSLIEPRYQMYSARGLQAPNSNHPGDSTVSGNSGIPISVSSGEKLLAKVYGALVNNPDLFAKTLLVVTYDEHGGLFDHVAPPAAPSPFTARMTNYNYETYGARVPAIFINPYVKPGIFRSAQAGTYFDHTSLLATLRDQFGLTGSLSPRVDKAPAFQGLINTANQPIPSQAIELPVCNWNAAGVEPGHGWPVLQAALRRAQVIGRKNIDKT
jgi:phospholipase C